MHFIERSPIANTEENTFAEEDRETEEE